MTWTTDFRPPTTPTTKPTEPVDAIDALDALDVTELADVTELTGRTGPSAASSGKAAGTPTAPATTAADSAISATSATCAPDTASMGSMDCKTPTGRLRGLLRGHTPGPGTPRTAFAYLPFLLLGMGAISNVLRSETPDPVVGGIGLFVFNTLYIFVVFRSFDPRSRNRPGTYWALAAMAAVTFTLAITQSGGSWLMFIPLLALACGTVLRGKWLAATLVVLSTAGSVIAGVQNGTWDAVVIGYGSVLSGLVTAALLSLSETIVELRETRQELARAAVEQERLRFSRDLHDLLGHTLSVIVVKSEAARRLGRRDLDAAMAQVDDIETVGRQALAEIREAVTGYREGSLGSELDRARDTLGAAGIASVVRQSGPPLPPEVASLLGWVVRESVTNAVRHSGAGQCEIEVAGTDDRVRLVFTDDGSAAPASAPHDPSGHRPGSGLRGLAERLTAAGGTLDSGPLPDRGFRVVAQVPVGTGTAPQAPADPQ